MTDKSDKFLRNIIFSCLFASIISIFAFVSIPIGAVPIVLQNMMVVLSGIILGPLYGSIAVLIFLLMGLLGLPVFSGFGSGLSRFLGPTGGFLYGYILSCFFSGLLTFFLIRKKYKGFLVYLKYLLISLIGFLLLYPSGIYHYIRYSEKVNNTAVTVSVALKVCFIPFLIPDLIKLVLSSLIAYKTKPITDGILKKE